MAIICTNIPLFFSSRKILTLFLSIFQAIDYIKNIFGKKEISISNEEPTENEEQDEEEEL